MAAEGLTRDTGDPAQRDIAIRSAPDSTGMADETKPTAEGDGDDSDGTGMAIGMGTGVAIGVAIGVAMDNLAIGIAIGVAIGAGMGTAM